MSDKIDETKETEPSSPPPGAETAETGAGERDDEPGDAPTSKGDSELTQEDLARRVDALAKDEDEADRIARVEEAKLAERRAKQKKAGKKGLEASAAKRLAKIGTKDVDRATAKRAVAVAADADPLIDRTAQLGKWVEKNSQMVGWIVGGILVAALGIVTVNYFREKKEADASAELTRAVADQHGRIGDPERDTSNDRFNDPTPIFKTEAERRESALKRYREVTSKFSGTGAATLARLAEAGILLDKHEPDAALTALNEVKSSPLGQADADVRARALEGIGFAYELKAMPAVGGAKPADAEKSLDDALKAFKDLEATDIKGYKELGMYHQARVYEAKGDKAKALEILKSLHERTTKPGENHPFPYLEQVADDRLRALDPTAIPPKQTTQLGGGGGGHGGPGGGSKLSQEQIKKLIEQMQKQGGGGGGGAPPMPMPMPPPENK